MCIASLLLSSTYLLITAHSLRTFSGLFFSKAALCSKAIMAILTATRINQQQPTAKFLSSYTPSPTFPLQQCASVVIPWTSSFWELLSVYNLKLKETNLCLPTDGILSKYLTSLTFPSSNLQHTGDKSSLSPSTGHYPSCFFALLLPHTSLPIWPEMYRNIL